MDTIKTMLKYSDIPGKDKFGIDSQTLSPENILQDAFTAFCNSLDKPLVVFFDEADCLGGQTLISFLRQLRIGLGTDKRAALVSQRCSKGIHYAQRPG